MILRHYVPRYLAARDASNEAASQEVCSWIYTHRTFARRFLAGLIRYAEVTVRGALGMRARQALADTAEAWRHSPRITCCDSETVEGYLAAAEMVDYCLRGDYDSAYDVLDRLEVTWNLTWGAAAGLADLTIESARSEWGSATHWINGMVYMITGQGDPDVKLSVPDPSLGLSAVLGEPNEPASAGRSCGTLGDAFAGGRLVTSFLCYRDAGATRSEHDIRDWLLAHPATMHGFLGGLANITYECLLAEEGDHALAVARSLAAVNCAGSGADAAGVDSVEEFSEGYRSAAPLLVHMIRSDNIAWSALLLRLQETHSLAWGAATALADMTRTTIQAAHGSATELLHDLHAYTVGAMTDAGPVTVR